MKVFNTETKSLEEFESIEPEKVKMYQCGPTVYWVQHIGNMRAMVAGDLIRRTLAYLGYDVTYVRNYTDFGHLVSDEDEGEDKMEKGARREGLSAKEIAEKYIKIFDEDVAVLNNLKPTYSTKATDYIAQMIEIIKGLLDKGYAYSTPEAIYFDISKAKDYTRLSGQRLEMLVRGAGHGEDGATQKRNPADFALWFFRTGTHANTSLYWESPFDSPEVENGVGTPGWHVECSAMAIAKLGPSMDIHMGGVEHIPIHHTNEIAQSESYTGERFAKYWLHNEHLTVAGEKMSKSEGTAYTMKDIIERGYNPMHLRYLFLQAHYRSKQDFTWETLDAAKTAYERLITKIAAMPQTGGSVPEEYKAKFVSAIEQDFGLPQALAVAWEMLSNSNISEADKYAALIDFDNVLGLQLGEAVTHAGEPSAIPEEVSKLLAARELARDSKEFELSDKLRDQILDLGYLVKDTPDGQVIEKR